MAVAAVAAAGAGATTTRQRRWRRSQSDLRRGDNLSGPGCPRPPKIDIREGEFKERRVRSVYRIPYSVWCFLCVSHVCMCQNLCVTDSIN